MEDVKEHLDRSMTTIRNEVIITEENLKLQYESRIEKKGRDLLEVENEPKKQKTKGIIKEKGSADVSLDNLKDSEEDKHIIDGVKKRLDLVSWMKPFIHHFPRLAYLQIPFRHYCSKLCIDFSVKSPFNWSVRMFTALLWSGHQNKLLSSSKSMSVSWGTNTIMLLACGEEFVNYVDTTLDSLQSNIAPGRGMLKSSLT
uniref:Uncharacterized protein isoform X3 n=4 Tax=Nicotiana tabacum TaxID=4097 RepID=A0A1S3X4R1_TOBAC|nr:PREDICTED: uncharacterized protein LOC107761045 isoform X3 [Nicotiana tabacum]XP_016434699.1 PREDICTED: uncharacterized protein LOC107761045 isoform X3 [Nicotiana tabacum]